MDISIIPRSVKRIRIKKKKPPFGGFSFEYGLKIAFVGVLVLGIVAVVLVLGVVAGVLILGVVAVLVLGVVPGLVLVVVHVFLLHGGCGRL